jgi:hypothetical protein
MLGVLFVALKDLEPGFQQTFQLWVGGCRNQGRFERVVHCLMVGSLVLRVGAIESRPF